GLPRTSGEAARARRPWDKPRSGTPRRLAPSKCCWCRRCRPTSSRRPCRRPRSRRITPISRAERYRPNSVCPRREAIQNELDRRRPLGTRCLVNWARYKTVHVKARIVAYREEDAEALTERFRERLYQLINPVAWQFGLPLRASAVHNLLLGEPG